MVELINRTYCNFKLNDDIKNYNLNLEQEILLKNLIMLYLIMTRNEENIDELIDILINKIKSQENIRTSVQDMFYLVVQFVFDKNQDNKDFITEVIDNYLKEGYYFHSTNGCLISHIETHGFDLSKNIWDYKEIEEIKTIFSRKGKTDIFGLFQVNKINPIFFSPSLETASYYAISSPSWFAHFTSGGMGSKENYDKEAYRNRNYISCLKNVINLCIECNLELEEKAKVLNFFDKYYVQLTGSKYPKMILIKRKYFKPVIDFPDKEPKQSDVEYFINLVNLNCLANVLVRNTIPKENILIIDYNSKERKVLL